MASDLFICSGICSCLQGRVPPESRRARPLPLRLSAHSSSATRFVSFLTATWRSLRSLRISAASSSDKILVLIPWVDGRNWERHDCGGSSPKATSAAPGTHTPRARWPAAAERPPCRVSPLRRPLPLLLHLILALISARFVMTSRW